jgi:D-cysteine desulfhydrase family pyridoxal phosphate-dependent enzyme
MTSDWLHRLADLPRVPLLSRPTPLEPWPRLSQELGVRLFAKRDDLGGIGLGGNKLRKLELLVGKALSEGATWLLTIGGPQSNHARLTAAVAAKLGLGCTLLLRGNGLEINGGNLLLDRLFGADVRFVDAPDYGSVYDAMEREAERLRKAGERPISIPLGGATAEGTAAYASACSELLEQAGKLGIRPNVIVLAAGTASTYTGLWLGTRLLDPALRVIGVSVSWSEERLVSEARRLGRETRSLLGLPPDDAAEPWFDDGFTGPGYAKVSKDGLAAVKQVARSEGAVLDTTYTGKAFAGLIGLVRRGDIAGGSQVVFVHTGGVPELFSRPVEILD